MSSLNNIIGVVETPTLKERHRQPWTAADLAFLKDGVVAGMSFRAMAEELSRTEEGVRWKAVQQGIYTPPKRRRRRNGELTAAGDAG